MFQSAVLALRANLSTSPARGKVSHDPTRKSNPSSPAAVTGQGREPGRLQVGLSRLRLRKRGGDLLSAGLPRPAESGLTASFSPQGQPGARDCKRPQARGRGVTAEGASRRGPGRRRGRPSIGIDPSRTQLTGGAPHAPAAAARPLDVRRIAGQQEGQVARTARRLCWHGKRRFAAAAQRHTRARNCSNGREVNRY